MLASSCGGLRLFATAQTRGISPKRVENPYRFSYCLEFQSQESAAPYSYDYNYARIKQLELSQSDKQYSSLEFGT